MHAKNRTGITLTEVVVGISLLGTLLTSILVASGQLWKQQKLAKEKLLAIELLDQITSKYFHQGFPELDTRMELASQKKWVLTLRALPDSRLDDELIPIRLEVLKANPSSSDWLALARVDLLLTRDDLSKSGDRR